MSLRILVPVTGAFAGRLRVRRSTGELDTEGLERVLSGPSVRAISLAMQLKDDATLVAAHVDKGAGEEVLREALSFGIDQGILIAGASGPVDASTRASTIADVYRQNGPFDAVIGPARSEFAGFSGALAAMAGQLDLPCVHGVRDIEARDDGFTIGYASIFGEYKLNIPRPSVIMAGDVPMRYPTAWGVAKAYGEQGVMRVQADQYNAEKARTRRERIENLRPEATNPEEVDAATLIRRLRSRALIPEGSA